MRHLTKGEQAIANEMARSMHRAALMGQFFDVIEGRDVVPVVVELCEERPALRGDMGRGA